MSTILQHQLESLETLLARLQRYLSLAPVLVIGSGASAPYGVPGMQRLTEHLVNSVTPTETDAKHRWAEISAQLQMGTTDLETALQQHDLPSALLREVVDRTREVILRADLAVFASIVDGSTSLALTRLLRFLLQSTQTSVSVLTTNYDRLVEYAAEQAGYPWDSGFGHGYHRQWAEIGHWQLHRNRRRAKCVHVLKVHGSVDWVGRGNEAWSLSVERELWPDGAEPLMVTPGLSKYRATHYEPFRSIVQYADRVLAHARAYLCVGYGFNDEHIQPKLVAGVNAGKPLVVLTKTLTTSARRLLQSGEVVDYVALEEDQHGTKCYTSDNPGGMVLEGLTMWNLDSFLQIVQRL